MDPIHGKKVPYSCYQTVTCGSCLCPFSAPLATNLFNNLRCFQAFPKKTLREFCVT